MNKVITINLNANAYQVDEDGYEALTAYLDRASDSLSDNPDRDEIVADLEQAIADKCDGFLGPHKSVVSGREVTQILEAMGPVDSAVDEQQSRSPGSYGSEPRVETSGSANADTGEPRRLYRIKHAGDKYQVEGVCAGLAAYFGMDPTIVRVIFVALLLMSAGTAGALYLLLVMVIPEAKTPEERAAAHGAPFNAQDVLNQAKAKGRDLKREWDAQTGYWHQSKTAGPAKILGLIIAGFVGVMVLMSVVHNLGPSIVGPTGSVGPMGPPVRMLALSWLPWVVILGILGLLFVAARRSGTSGPLTIAMFVLILFVGVGMLRQVWMGGMFSMFPWNPNRLPFGRSPWISVLLVALLINLLIMASGRRMEAHRWAFHGFVTLLLTVGLLLLA